MMKRPDRDPAVEALLAANRHEDAAVALAHSGRLEEAQHLYEHLWNFRAAAEIARSRGDLADSLRCVVAARDLTAAAEMARELANGPPEIARRAVPIYEAARLYAECARLCEQLGDLDAAARAYESAKLPLEVARIDEMAGRARAAGQRYERVLAEGGRDEDLALVRLRLGRVLMSFNRHDEAVRHLQRAVTAGVEGDQRKDALTRLVTSLAMLGYREAAQIRLTELSTIPLDRFLREAAEDRDARGADAPILAGRYRIEALLGSGAVGRVYRAHDLLKDRAIALKIVAPPVDERSRAAYARFVNEARFAASLRHPNVVELFEVEEVFGIVAMELMERGTLRDEVARGSLPLPRAREVVRALAQALELTHARGFIHRDVKPDNVFVSASGAVKLGDFGAAHLQSTGMTQTAGFVGTLLYMSPEQITGGELTPAVDAYGLGATLYELLTGRPPFVGSDLVGQHLAAAVAPPSSLRALPPAWDILVRRLLAKDASDRPSMTELLQLLPELPVDERHAAQSTESAPADPKPRAAKRERYLRGTQLAATSKASLHDAQDRVLGRALWVERLAPSFVASDPGRAHLAWIKRAAALPSSMPQRVFDIVALSDGSVEIVYEALVGSPADPASLSADEARRLSALRSCLARAGLPEPPRFSLIREATALRWQLAQAAPTADR